MKWQNSVRESVAILCRWGQTALRRQNVWQTLIMIEILSMLSYFRFRYTIQLLCGDRCGVVSRLKYEMGLNDAEMGCREAKH